MALNNKFFEKKEIIDPKPDLLDKVSGLEKFQPTKSEIGPEAGEAVKEKPSQEDAAQLGKIPRVTKKKPSRSKKNIDSVAPVNDPKVFAIKNVLGKGLGSSYQKMSLGQQKEFLKEEEEVAVEIKGVLSKGKIRTRKIFKLIFKWLRIIPFASNFFARQEAKIKTDGVIDLEKKK